MYADLCLRRADIGVLDSIPDRVLVVSDIRPVLNINDDAHPVGLSRWVERNGQKRDSNLPHAESYHVSSYEIVRSRRNGFMRP
jgi:hypothetical protein